MELDGGAGSARVLGPVQVVRADGGVVDPGSPTQRRLLAVLALASPRSVRRDRLCDVLGLSPSAVRTSVSRLRRTVGGRIVTTTTGYRLDLPVDAVLLCRELGEAGRDPDALDRVLDRWGGGAVEEFATEPWAIGEVGRLEEIRSNAVEDRAEALVEAGRAGEAIAALDGHVADHPYRDRAWGLLIRALSAAGRQAEALRAYQRYRDRLADEVGTAPSDQVRDIERRVATGWDGVNVLTQRRSQEAAPAPGPPSGLASDAPFVGRGDELDVLHDAVRSARAAGSLRTVTVVGTAGIGKTSLLAAFAGRVTGDAASVVYGRCDETASVALQPFRTVVGALVAHLPTPVLAAHVDAHGGALVRLAPVLARRVDVREPVATDDTTGHFLLFEAVADLFVRAAHSLPLVVLLDDVHWADATALQLLAHLARASAGSPIVLVVSLRPPDEEANGPVRTALAELGRSESCRIELGGLDDAGIGALTAAVFDVVAGRPAHWRRPADLGEVTDHLRRETAGNPLFATQLVRHWITEGSVRAEGGTLRLTPGTGVPPSLRDVVLHRVASLGPTGRTVLEAAAVLGPEFDGETLGGMVDLPPPRVDEAVAAATRAGLLTEVGPGRCRFTHALVASVVASAVPGPHRRRLHERAALAMLRVEGVLGPARPAALAHHFEQGARFPEALRWAKAAGDESLDQLAPLEAVEWYRRASALAAQLGRSAAERADLVVRRGEAEVRAGQDAGLATLLEGAALARRAGAGGALVHAALASDCGRARLGGFAGDQLRLVEWALEEAEPDTGEEARLLALLGQCLVHTDHGARRQAAAGRALELARASQDPTLLARIAPSVLHALWLPGSTALRTRVAAEAIRSAERAGDPYLAYLVHAAAYDAAVTSGDASAARHSDARRRDLVGVVGDRGRWMIGISDTFAHTMAARFDEAEQVADRTLHLGLRIGEADAFGLYAAQLYVLRTFQGRHAEVLPFVEKLLADETTTLPLPFHLGYGIACAATGRLDVGRSQLQEGAARQFHHVPADLFWMTSIIGYAVLAVELADVDAARLLYPVIAPYAAEVSFNGSTSQGPVAAYLGKLASLLGRHDAAEEHLHDALTLTDRFGWTYHRATTLYGMAEARLRRTHRADDATRALLDEAVSICRSVGIANWAERAEALRRASA